MSTVRTILKPSSIFAFTVFFISESSLLGGKVAFGNEGADIARLQTNVAAQEKILDDLSYQMVERKEQIDRLEIPDMESDRDNQKEELQQLATDLADNQNRKAQLKAENDAFWRENSAIARQAEEHSTTELQIARDDLRESEAQLRDLQEKALYDGALVLKLPAMREDVEARRAYLQALENEALRSEAQTSNSFANESAAFSTEEANLEDQWRQLKSAYDENKAAYDESNRGLKQAYQTRSTLLAEISKLKTQRDLGGTKLKEMQAELRLLQKGTIAERAEATVHGK